MAARRPPLDRLYEQMCRIRYVEETLRDLWQRGLVSGEMHLGVGEEALIAGTIAHLIDGDAVAVDYRSTPSFVARGVDIPSLLFEMLGDERGLCRGHGGHMHLMSRERLMAASGIVGAPAPLACGFGLAADEANRGRVAVCLFGDGAVNEGMVMESLNLAAVWRLPVVFVCKDNRWAVTTRSSAVTGGGLRRRASGFGLPVRVVDGSDVSAVWRVAGRAVLRARRGQGPTFVLARVSRLEGHFLGDPLLRIVTATREAVRQTGPLVRALAVRPGAPLPQRVSAFRSVMLTIATAAVERAPGRNRDPLVLARRRLPERVATRIESLTRSEVDDAAVRVLAAVSPGA